jgi:hypothetical protein
VNLRRVVPLLVSLALAGAACGVGAQQTAQLIDPHDVPRGLLSPASTTTPVPIGPARVTVYFDGPNGLVPVVRKVSSPASVQVALAQLEKGPSPSDGGGDLQSPVSTVSPFVLKRQQNGVAYVSVPDSFTNLGGQEQIVAVAQLVYTVTAVAGIGAVVLLVNGQLAQVPVAGGTLQQGPLTRADYAGLRPS